MNTRKRWLLPYGFSALAIACLVLPTQSLHAQALAEISGIVTDAVTGETLPGTNITLWRGSEQQGGTASNINGSYSLGGLEPGKYRLIVSYVAYQPDTLLVTAGADQVTWLPLRLAPNGSLEGIVVHGRKLIEGGGKELVITMSGDELKHRPTRDPVAAAASRSPRIHDSDGTGQSLHIAGSRSDAVAYYIDGVRVIGSLNVPANAVADVSVYAGGIPARYGDVTGGVIVIRTKSYMAFLQ